MFQSGAAPSPQGGCKNGSSVYSEYITDDSGLNMIANSSVESSGSAMSSVSSMSMSMSMPSSGISSSMSMMSTTMPSSTPAMSTTAMPNATAASSATATPNKSDHSLKGGAIAGVVIGVVAAVGFVVLVALCFRRNSRRKDGIGHEKTSDVETTPKQFAAELSGEQGSPNSLGPDRTVGPYPAPWTSRGYQQPQTKPNDAISTVDSRSTTAASGRISGYSDLSASATVLSPTSTPSRDQLRAEIERVRKQRHRLEEMNALSEREEELERELSKGGL
jgi:hypothetical protein